MMEVHPIGDTLKRNIPTRWQGRKGRLPHHQHAQEESAVLGDSFAQVRKNEKEKTTQGVAAHPLA